MRRLDRRVLAVEIVRAIRVRRARGHAGIVGDETGRRRRGHGDGNDCPTTRDYGADGAGRHSASRTFQTAGAGNEGRARRQCVGQDHVLGVVGTGVVHRDPIIYGVVHLDRIDRINLGHAQVRLRAQRFEELEIIEPGPPSLSGVCKQVEPDRLGLGRGDKRPVHPDPIVGADKGA